MRGCISALLPDLGTHFLLLGCLSLNMRVLYLALLYLVVSWKHVFFLKENGGVVDLGGVEQGGWENWREEKLVGMYCMREELVFSKTKRK